MSEEKKDFIVKDRRMFTEDGQEKGEDSTEEPAAAVDQEKPESEPQPEPEKDAAEASEETPEEETQLPEINFSTFVFSLNASALVNLGEIENPGTGKKEKDLPLAKQTIDILGMLEEKTSGNLNDDEANLLKNILYDLRLNYVKKKG
jgi:hypothetical protein